MPDYINSSIEKLLHVIVNIPSEDDALAFFNDLCTIKELQDMAQRFETALLLSEGRNYQEISATVGISTATISRVSRCLNYGSGGYRKAIEFIKENETV